MNIQKFSLFLLVFILGACSGGKPASQTSFELSGLSALIGNATTIPGGLVLTGTNGVDKFTAGLTPQQIATFNVDLPQGNWSFSAIAWLGADLMSGATQCGSSTSTIEGTSVTVSLVLSVANCQLPEFASPSSFAMGAPNEFKTLTINSCLNPVGKPVNDICDGLDLTTYNDIPGESLSFRVQVSSGSNFGASMNPLTSNCYNISSLPGSLSSGQVHTNLTLPYGGTNTFPLRILAYEEPNCLADDLSSVYTINGGIQGTQGAYRTTALSFTDILFVNIADNYIGTLGSPFLSAHLGTDLTLPFPVCGNSCFQTADNSRGGTNWHVARDAAWTLFGSPDRKNTYDFEADVYNPGTQTYTTGGGGNFNLMTFANQPGDYEMFPTHSPGANPPTVSCSPASLGSQGSIIITYDETTVMVSAIVAALNADPTCNTGFTANLNTEGGGTIDTPMILQPNVVTGAYIPKRREEGSLNSVANTLVGPVGALLYKNGITTFADICGQNITVSESLPVGEVVTVQLSNATASAVLPMFPTNPDAGNFERKVLVSFNSQPSEVFYFNCSPANKGIGAYVQRENENGKTQIGQMQWDTTATEQWVEEIYYYDNPAESETWREYSLAHHISGGPTNIWSLGGRSLIDGFHKITAQIDSVSGNVYIQDSTSLTNADPNFISNGTDDGWFNIANGAYNTLTPIVTTEPGRTSNILSSTDLDFLFTEDPANPAGVFLLSY